MIQRLQSFYLLLVTILMSLLVMMPYGEVTMTDEWMVFKSYAITYLTDQHNIQIYKLTIPVIALVLITGIISLVTIFLYNKRTLQIRLSVFNALLILALSGSMLYYYITTVHLQGVTVSSFRLPMGIPVLAFICCMLAIRHIRKDELLVDSYNRLR